MRRVESRRHGRLLAVLTAALPALSCARSEIFDHYTEPPAPGRPRLFFSDLESGPKSGFEGSSTRGAAVSVWGLGFGPERGDSHVTVNGAVLASDSDYAEWGERANNARGLERITFWLNDRCEDGDGVISVTVLGGESNALPFTVRSGNIYFIATDGDDRWSGRLAARDGPSSSEGPWLHFSMANGDHNPALAPGDIVYVRGGVYSDGDALAGGGGEAYNLYLRDFSGEPGRPFVIAGYPGEWPVLGTGGTPQYGLSLYPGEGAASSSIGYLQVHKLISENPEGFFHGSGVHHVRLAGVTIRNSPGGFQSALIHSGAGWSWQILGLTVRDSGFDSTRAAISISGAWSSVWSEHASSDWEIAWSELDHFRSDQSGPSGYGAPAIRVSNGLPDFDVHNVSVHDSLFHEMPDAVALMLENNAAGGMHDISFRNNVMNGVAKLGAGSAVAAIRSDALSLYLDNNTFFDVGQSGGYCSDASDHGCAMSPLYQADRGVTYSRNNLFALRDPLVPYYWGALYGVVSSENDLFSGGLWRDLDGTQYVVADALHDLEPRFVDPQSGDLRLAADSPAIDRGTSAVAAAVPRDFDGLRRPAPGSALYDIGAYEHE